MLWIRWAFIAPECRLQSAELELDLPKFIEHVRQDCGCGHLDLAFRSSFSCCFLFCAWHLVWLIRLAEFSRNSSIWIASFVSPLCPQGLNPLRNPGAIAAWCFTLPRCLLLLKSIPGRRRREATPQNAFLALKERACSFSYSCLRCC